MVFVRIRYVSVITAIVEDNAIIHNNFTSKLKIKKMR